MIFCNFRLKNCWAILGGFFRDADPSTALRDPGRAKGSWAGEGILGGRREPAAGLEGFYDFGGFVKIWESQFFCKAVVHFGCGFGFHGDAGQDRDVEFL